MFKNILNRLSGFKSDPVTNLNEEKGMLSGKQHGETKTVARKAGYWKPDTPVTVVIIGDGSRSVFYESSDPIT